MLPLRDENPTSRLAIVTLALIVINLGVYFGLQFPKSARGQTDFDYRWGAIPCELRTGKPAVAVPEGTSPAASACTVTAGGISAPQVAFPGKNVWLALVVSMFLHGSAFHVLTNMLFLWIFGNNVEDQLGRAGFLAFYLVGGIVAAFVHVVGNLGSSAPFLGASGAIAVVMGAYLVWFPRARVVTLVIFVVIPWIFRFPAALVLGVWFLLQFVIPSSTNIATLAHIGGFVFGALVAFVLARVAAFPRVRVPRVPGY